MVMVAHQAYGPEGMYHPNCPCNMCNGVRANHPIFRQTPTHCNRCTQLASLPPPGHMWDWTGSVVPIKKIKDWVPWFNKYGTKIDWPRKDGSTIMDMTGARVKVPNAPNLGPKPVGNRFWVDDDYKPTPVPHTELKDVRKQWGYKGAPLHPSIKLAYEIAAQRDFEHPTLGFRGERDDFPILAHRRVKLERVDKKWKLRSVAHSTILEPWMRAKCGSGGEGNMASHYATIEGEVIEPSPGVNCQCGFYAIPLGSKPAAQFDGYDALVQLSGRIIKHELGYRAEVQQILTVYIGEDFCWYCGEKQESGSAIVGMFDDMALTRLTTACPEHIRGDMMVIPKEEFERDLYPITIESAKFDWQTETR